MLRIDCPSQRAFLLAIQLAARGLALADCERGQDLIEYALILALVALVVAGVLSAFAGDLGPMYSTIVNAIPAQN
jgi:Flp pilus assembly pilin Flp